MGGNFRNGENLRAEILRAKKMYLLKDFFIILCIEVVVVELPCCIGFNF